MQKRTYFWMKPDKRKELQDGRTVAHIAELSGYARQYLNYIFLGKMGATRNCVERIINAMSGDSLNIALMLNQKGMNQVIQYFFEEE